LSTTKQIFATSLRVFWTTKVSAPGPARDSDSALTEIANRRPHLVFLDIWLQGSKLDGLQLLEQIKKDNAELPVVMISGHGNIETAVAAIKRAPMISSKSPSRRIG